MNKDEFDNCYDGGFSDQIRRHVFIEATRGLLYNIAIEHSCEGTHGWAIRLMSHVNSAVVSWFDSCVLTIDTHYWNGDKCIRDVREFNITNPNSIKDAIDFTRKGLIRLIKNPYQDSYTIRCGQVPEQLVLFNLYQDYWKCL